MKVSIFGLGYVGSVTAGCLAERGHAIIGVDVQAEKVAAFNAGRSPIMEPELDALLSTAHRAGRLSATLATDAAVMASEASLICVGTPSLTSGQLNLAFVKKVCEQISATLRKSGKPHVILFRSTMLPGSTRALMQEFFADLHATGQVTIYYCPEFLREGSAVQDFRDPSLTVLGTHDGHASESHEVMEFMPTGSEVLTWEGAEMIKYACNYLHALKIGFANEIGRLCKHIGEDGARVMSVVCSDTRLNVSAHYLKPGTPFGGSCLPKDVSALVSMARQAGLTLPLLDHALPSNSAHLDLLLRLITCKKVRRIGILGLAFKADTDDLRGSAMVSAAETLIGLGYEVQIYDPGLNLSRLIGANAEEMTRRMPHLASLLKADIADVISHAQLLVISQPCAPLATLRQHAKADQHVIDVNGWRELEGLAWSYEGLCW
jgi:GDP-mannose 6-dehydrogenase